MSKDYISWHSLRFKLVALAVVVEILMLSILVWNSVRLTNEHLIEQTDHRIYAEILPLLNASLAGPLFQEDLAIIRELLEQVVSDEALTYVGVLNSEDKLLIEYGLVTRDPHFGDSFVEHMQKPDAAVAPFGGKFPITLNNREIGQLVFTFDTSFLQRAIKAVTHEGFVIAIIGVILSIIILSVAGYILTTQLYCLMEASVKIAEGDLSVRVPVNGHDELAETSRAFNLMAAETAERTTRLEQALTLQQQTEIILRERESHYRVLVESAHAIPWELDLNTWKFTYVGPQAERMLGYPVEQWYEEGFWADHIFHEDRDAAINFCVNETNKGHDHDFEYRMIAADGHDVWVRDSVNVISDNTGPVQLSGFMFDISRRKQDELELTRYREHLEELVNERTRELTIAKEEADAANMAKTAFMSRMSHELRTPLNAVIGFSSIIQFDLEKTDTHYMHASEIINAGKHLLILIEEIMDLSRIERGEINISLCDVDLNRLIDSCITYIRPMAKQHNINIDIHTSDVLIAYADETRLKEVVLNLLSNAVKYNRDGGEIIIDCKLHGEKVILSISDTGKGLSEQQLAMIFEPFSRLGAEFTGIEGTGIGMTISKQLIELMHGEIQVNSVVGEGTTILLILPVSDTVARGSV